MMFITIAKKKKCFPNRNEACSVSSIILVIALFCSLSSSSIFVSSACAFIQPSLSSPFLPKSLLSPQEFTTSFQHREKISLSSLFKNSNNLILSYSTRHDHDHGNDDNNDVDKNTKNIRSDDDDDDDDDSMSQHQENNKTTEKEQKLVSLDKETENETIQNKNIGPWDKVLSIMKNNRSDDTKKKEKSSSRSSSSSKLALQIPIDIQDTSVLYYDIFLILNLSVSISFWVVHRLSFVNAIEAFSEGCLVSILWIASGLYNGAFLYSAIDGNYDMTRDESFEKGGPKAAGLLGLWTFVGTINLRMLVALATAVEGHRPVGASNGEELIPLELCFGLILMSMWRMLHSNYSRV